MIPGNILHSLSLSFPECSLGEIDTTSIKKITVNQKSNQHELLFFYLKTDVLEAQLSGSGETFYFS